MCRRVQVDETTGKPGYVKLWLTQNRIVQQINKLFKAAVDVDGLLSPVILARQFHGELKQCLQQCQKAARENRDWTWRSEQLRDIDVRTTLRHHGPAVQMDVYETPAKSLKLYSVDIIPTIQISGRDGENDYYVAKPIKGSSSPLNTWRRSFSMKEKRALATLDWDNGCRKQVLRVLKVIRNREAGLAPLTSYHLKTALFRKIDELSSPLQWRSHCLGQRLMDVIGQMEKELGRGNMPHYYLPEVNLLDGLSGITISNMQHRLSRLWNSRQEMMRLLCGSTAIQPRFDSPSTAVQPHYDYSTTFGDCIIIVIKLIIGFVITVVVGIIIALFHDTRY